MTYRVVKIEPCENAVARIMDKVRLADGCWEFTGGLNRGYGRVRVGSRSDGSRRNLYTHRVVWEHYRGVIPEGLTLDHLCRNRACCNPDHLELVTMGENVRRGTGPTAVNAAKTHCPKGHPLAGDNLYVDPSNHRYCRTCRRDRNKMAKAAARRRRRWVEVES